MTKLPIQHTQNDTPTTLSDTHQQPNPSLESAGILSPGGQGPNKGAAPNQWSKSGQPNRPTQPATSTPTNPATSKGKIPDSHMISNTPVYEKTSASSGPGSEVLPSGTASNNTPVQTSSTNSYNSQPQRNTPGATTGSSRLIPKTQKNRRSSSHHSIYERPFIGAGSNSLGGGGESFSPSSSSFSRKNHLSNLPPNVSVKRQWGPGDLKVSNKHNNNQNTSISEVFENDELDSSVFEPEINPDASSFAAYINSLSKSALLTRDLFGRTILHLAARLSDASYTQIILNHPQADALTSIADTENGWVPLHTALDAGNMATAQLLLSHAPETASIRDNARMRPVDVLRSLIGKHTNFQNFERDANTNSLKRARRPIAQQQPGNNVRPDATHENINNEVTVEYGPTYNPVSAANDRLETLKKIIELEPRKRNGMTEILAVGSNTNHTLGFADGDDKAIPQKVVVERDLKISRPLFHRKSRQLYSSKLSRFVDPAESEEEEEEEYDEYSYSSESEESDGYNSDEESARKKSKESMKKIPISSPAAKFLPLQITDVQIAKYHSAVLSADKVGNLYVAGSARGGRLGLGHGQTQPNHGSRHNGTSGNYVNQHGNSHHQFTYKQVPAFANKRVKSVSLGSFHTVMLTSDGKVFTCGSNESGQLGYAIEENDTSDGDTSTGFFSASSNLAVKEQHYPRRVPNAYITSETIIGVAASKIHTVAYSENHLLLWGKNVGQMGFTPLETSYAAKASRNSSNFSSTFQLRDPRDGGIVQTTPRVYPGIFGPVSQVECCEIATVYITKDEGAVYVLMNSEHFRVRMPTVGTAVSLRGSNGEESFTSYQIKRQKHGRIVKIATSPKGYVCALDDTGIVYTFNLRPQYMDPATLDSIAADGADSGNAGFNGADRDKLKGHYISKNLKVKVLWNVSTSNLQAVDAAVADDGSIIVCTREGTVWRSSVARSVKNTKPATTHAYHVTPPQITIIPYADQGTRYYYEQFIHANRVFGVRTDALFSQFIMLREEYVSPPLGVSSSLSQREYAHLLSQLAGGSNTTSGFVVGDGYAINSYFSKLWPSQNYTPFFPRNRTTSDSLEFSPSRQKQKQLKSEQFFEDERSTLLTGLIGSSYKFMSFPGDFDYPYLPDPVEPHFDLEIRLILNPHATNSEIKSVRIAACHALFFLSRIPAFEELVENPNSELVSKRSDITVKFEPQILSDSEPSVGTIIFSGISAETLQALVAYVYTDDFFFGRDRLPIAGLGDDKDLAKMFDQAVFGDANGSKPTEKEAILQKEDMKLEIYKLCRILGIMSDYQPHHESDYGQRLKGGRNQSTTTELNSKKVTPRLYRHKLSSTAIIAMFRGDTSRPNTVGRDLLDLVGESYLSSPKTSQELDSLSPFQKLVVTIPDVDIKLQDGKHVYLHSYILSTRVAFFSACLSRRWYKDSDLNTTGILFECDLSHISLPIFKIIIAHIYGDYGVELFSHNVAQHTLGNNNKAREPLLQGVKFHTPSEFIDFVKHVWVASDSLTLSRLSEACQAVLSEFIDSSTVCDLLEFCHQNDGYKLQQSCVQYVFENVEYLFENGVLSDLSYASFDLVRNYIYKVLGIDEYAEGVDYESLKSFFLFLNDFESFNEYISSTAILQEHADASSHRPRTMSRSKDKDRRGSFRNIVGQSTEPSTPRRSVSGSGSGTPKSDDSDLLFNIDMDDGLRLSGTEEATRSGNYNSLPPGATPTSSAFSSRRVSFNTTTLSTSTGWQVVGARKPSFPSSSRAAVAEALRGGPSNVSSSPSFNGSVSASGRSGSTGQIHGQPLTNVSSTVGTSINSTSSPVSSSNSSSKKLDESAFPSLGTWTTKDRRDSTVTNEREESSSSGPSTPALSAQGTKPPVVQSNTTKLFKSAQTLRPVSNIAGVASEGSAPKSSTLSFNSDVSTSDVYSPAITVKLSKKDRKRLQQQQAEEERRAAQEPKQDSLLLPTVSSPTTSSNPWRIPTGKATAPVALPFSIYSDKPSSGHKSNEKSGTFKHQTETSGNLNTISNPSSSVHSESFAATAASMSPNTYFAPPTLADIIQQEKLYTEIKAKQGKKSLKEIQEEEEFARWWKQESERVQKEELERDEREKAEISKATRQSKGNKNKSKGRNKKPIGAGGNSANSNNPSNSQTEPGKNKGKGRNNNGNASKPQKGNVSSNNNLENNRQTQKNDTQSHVPKSRPNENQGEGNMDNVNRIPAGPGSGKNNNRGNHHSPRSQDLNKSKGRNGSPITASSS